MKTETQIDTKKRIGPFFWKTDSGAGVAEEISVSTANGHTIDFREDEATQRGLLLGEAAPEMLAALQAQDELDALNKAWDESMDASGSLRETIMEARYNAEKLRATAIAKATGKGGEDE